MFEIQGSQRDSFIGLVSHSGEFVTITIVYISPHFPVYQILKMETRIGTQPAPSEKAAFIGHCGVMDQVWTWCCNFEKL